MENNEKQTTEEQPTTSQEVQGGLGCIQVILAIIMILFAIYVIFTV